MNNADYGMTMQKIICEKYGLDITTEAMGQFNSNYNSSYRTEIEHIVPIIFSELNDTPVRLLTYSTKMLTGKHTTSPHNFLLNSGKTLSIRTTKTSDKVAPKTVGQAGYKMLNDYFGEIYGKQIEDQSDVRKLIYYHIDELLPVFIDNLFQSDFTVFINKEDATNPQIINADELANYSFSRDEFTFTRDLSNWKESTTLKYCGKSVAEIQTHKDRTFKFRFILSNMPKWLKLVKTNNETLGMSAEGIICDYFGIKEPDSFATRTSSELETQLKPVVEEAFNTIPKPVNHTGSEAGTRGGQSKCPYDFVLQGGKTLSLKTNKGDMVCPPDVGQPGADTCFQYFERYFERDVKTADGPSFKKMVLTNINEIMPIYVSHMFDSDWLLWIYKKGDSFKWMGINKASINDFKWEKDKFSFTKKTVGDWNESNTVKYNGITIGEFQVHKNRSCFKFRFKMPNLLDILLTKSK